MATLDIEALRKRIEGIKEGVKKSSSAARGDAAGIQAAVQSTLSVLTIVYGADSHQVKGFITWAKPGASTTDARMGNFEHRLSGGIPGVLDAALADHESGLTASLRVLATGEVLGDFVALARAALSTGLADSQRVAAVLAAAALEETMKKLGELNGVDVFNRDYRGVVQKLQDAGVLSGAQPRLASGFSTFRDHASHGQFELIERGTTEAALAFVEGILSSRMS
jgi:hypothetical protein